MVDIIRTAETIQDNLEIRGFNFTFSEVLQMRPIPNLDLHGDMLMSAQKKNRIIMVRIRFYESGVDVVKVYSKSLKH